MTYEMYLGIHLLLAFILYMLIRLDLDSAGDRISRRDHFIVVIVCALWPLAVVAGSIIVLIAKAKLKYRSEK